MNMTFLMLCPVSRSPDSLYTVCFSLPDPAGWSCGPNWKFINDGIFLYPVCGCRAKCSDQDSISFSEFVVPQSADSLVLDFVHCQRGHGDEE